MMRRFALVAAAVTAMLIPAGAASAAAISTPGAGGSDCGVESGTLYVLEPGGPVLYWEDGQADFSDCV